MWLKGRKLFVIRTVIEKWSVPPSPVVEGANNQTMPICPKLIKIFQWLQPFNSHIYFFLSFSDKKIRNPSLSSTYTDSGYISIKNNPRMDKKEHIITLNLFLLWTLYLCKNIRFCVDTTNKIILAKKQSYLWGEHFECNRLWCKDNWESVSHALTWNTKLIHSVSFTIEYCTGIFFIYFTFQKCIHMLVQLGSLIHVK